MAYLAAMSAHCPQALHFDKTHSFAMASERGRSVSRVNSASRSDRQAMRSDEASSENVRGSCGLCAGTALAAAAISRATSKTIRCMITPKGCDHVMGSRGGQGFLCVNCLACSSAMATALTQLSGSSFPAQRSRKASAARVRHPASRSRSPWSRHRYSVRASKPKVYRKIASSDGGVLVSVISADYRTEMGVFHGPKGAMEHDLNRETALGGKAYPQRGA